MVVIHGPDDLTLEAVEAIAWGRAQVLLHPDALDRVAQGRERLRSAVGSGARIYGVSTGTGYLATVDLVATDLAALAAVGRTLLLGRAVGGPPYLPPEEARAVLAARLVNLLSGHAGVTPALCAYLVDRLNDGFTPAIPRTSIGCAGEVIPLAHAFQTLTGVGELLDGTPAAEALAERGAVPYEPQLKEGIALLAGAPATAAVAVGGLREARLLARQLLLSSACAIDALRAPLGPYHEQVGRLAGDPVLIGVLARLAVALEESAPDRNQSQAPVSFRVSPQVQAHLERTVARFDEDVRRTLAAVTDSPALTEAGVLSTGNFHAIDVAAGMESLGAALLRAAELSCQRLHRLLDHRFSGLPDQLTPEPGPRCGLIVAHKRAVGALHELRRLTVPAGVGLIDTSLGQEDALTFSFAAAESLRRAAPVIREILACELLACRQAWWLRRSPPAGGLEETATALRDLVAPINEDRPLGEDIDRVRGWLAAQAPPSFTR